MRAFKQFLSLVLVTCMLTSMVTLVSADYKLDQAWASDSGYIRITQENTELLDSRYTRVQDSGVDVDAGEFEVDLTQQDVTVTITGAKLADSGYTLKVYDTGKNLLYESEEKIPESNSTTGGESYNQRIDFSVSPVIMAIGSTLEIYREGFEQPGWKITYVAKAKNVESDVPVEIPPVIDETGTSSTIPAAAVETILSALGTEATSATVTVTKDENAESLLLDADVFKNAKFQSGFELNIQVTDNDKVYTWIFTSASAQNAISLMGNTDGSTVDLGVAMEEKNDLGKNGNISGTVVTLQSANVPSGKTAKLEVSTEREGLVNVYHQDDGTWFETEENKNLSVAEDETVIFKVVSGMTKYAIVNSNVTEDMMNGEGIPDPTPHDYELRIEEAPETVKVGDTVELTAKLYDSGNPVSADTTYVVEWDQNVDSKGTVEIKTVDSNVASVTGKTAGKVTVTATLVSVNGDEDQAANVSVEVSFEVTSGVTSAYRVELDSTTTTINVGETRELHATVYKDGQVLNTGYTLTWEVVDSDKVVQVDSQTGIVKGLAEGNATVGVTVTVGEMTVAYSSIYIIVNPEDTEQETHDYKVTIDQANATVEVGKTTTLTATVTDKGEKITEGYTIQWKVTPGTGSATVDAKGVVTGGTKGTVTVEATATIGEDIATSAPITVNVTSKGSTTPPTTGGGGSSSGGGGGSWNDGSHGSSMPSAGSGTTTTPGTGTTTPGTGTSGNAQPQGCVSDTVGNFSVKGSYQYKLTSTNGQAPAVTVSNSNFRVVLASQNGKDYFFKVYAIGAVGQTCDVLVNGTKVSTVTASEVYGGVSCDTTAPFTVKKGGSYQFKLTASSKPVMAAGSSSFRVEYVGNSGNDWFFKVYAVGNAGDGCGFYVNGAPFTVAVAHIGE